MASAITGLRVADSVWDSDRVDEGDAEADDEGEVENVSDIVLVSVLDVSRDVEVDSLNESELE